MPSKEVTIEEVTKKRRGRLQPSRGALPRWRHLVQKSRSMGEEGTQNRGVTRRRTSEPFWENTARVDYPSPCMEGFRAQGMC